MAEMVTPNEKENSDQGYICCTNVVQFYHWYNFSFEPVQNILYWFKKFCIGSKYFVVVQKFCTGSEKIVPKVKIELQQIYQNTETTSSIKHKLL